MPTCLVSYLDTDGIRHTVEVQADSLYEAAVLGICALRRHDLEPQGLSQLEVEIRHSIVHALTIKRVHQWVNRGAKTPKEAATKERLRELLNK